MRFGLYLLLFLIIPVIFACAIAPKTKMRQDPLIGQIIDAATHKTISFNTLVDKIASQDVIYLSEKHDNPIHHAIQHKIIQDLIEKGKFPVLGFEFFSMDDTPLLLDFTDSGKAKHSPKIEKAIEQQTRKQLNWDSQSDTMWAYYYDLLTLARDNNLLISGLDLSKPLRHRITRKGLEGLTGIEKKLIFSSRFSNGPYQARMKSIFKAVHCGMDHGKMTSRFYDTWVARNDKIALSISQLYEKNAKGPIVVIIGGGHTEYGLGVMDRVSAINPDISQVNIGLTEITIDPSELEDYMQPLELKGFDPRKPSDYLWFTQRVSYENPCEKFKASFKEMKQKK
ncbi:MAG: ChaN family lipoprotein [Desulfobacteraceae bacterium]|nr:ChaN family lipoprotein [Desulfobacteraceae bacterium]